MKRAVLERLDKKAIEGKRQIDALPEGGCQYDKLTADDGRYIFHTPKRLRHENAIGYGGKL